MRTGVDEVLVQMVDVLDHAVLRSGRHCKKGKFLCRIQFARVEYKWLRIAIHAIVIKKTTVFRTAKTRLLQWLILDLESVP
jgi:hypothetical protein